jgi:hypothetical protein
MCSRIEIETIMFKTVKFVLAATAVATLVACGGGGGGDDGAATAGTISLKASDLDGKYACVGGPTSFLFLTTGACTDNQILQGTCTRTVTITNDKYFDFVGATASSLNLNTGVIQGPDKKAYYYGRTNFADRLIYERYLPVLRSGSKVGVAVVSGSILDTSGSEYSLDGNKNLLVTTYGPKSLPRDLTYSSQSGGPGEIEVTTRTCNRI